MDKNNFLPEVGIDRSKELLKNAVYAQKEGQSLQDKIFALWFQQLVYPQIWEDPVVDLDALRIKPTDHVLTIASGGCNAMSYLIANPKKVTAVDLNHAHVALVKLKIEAAKQLTYEEFFKLFAVAKSASNIHLYDEKLAPKLDFATRQYWESGFKGFEKIRMFKKGFYKYGLLGRLIGLIHFVAKCYGVNLADLLKQKSIEDQGKWFDENVAKIFDSWLFRKITSSPFALYNLGIPPSQYKDLCNAQPGTMSQVLKERARKLATASKISENYFAWQAYGKGYELDNQHNLPPYLQEHTFDVLKKNIGKLDIEQNNIVDALKAMPAQSVDAVVLLDAQDWMSAQEIMALWTQITRTANHGARVIFRTAGFESPIDQALPEDLKIRWRKNCAISEQAGLRDRSGIYGAFYLYELAA
jgi:S-adenosylmethionine-diacylglycerol 3-amino-3-carboxypropyl transferase